MKFTCPVCQGASELLDVVDFNKSCNELKEPFNGLSGMPVDYVLCKCCGFCHCPEIYQWPVEKFLERIYNDEYKLFDPEYQEIRPRNFVASLLTMFPQMPATVRHLDFGGGNGKLAEGLRAAGWDSTSYDPLIDRDLALPDPGKFDLITAIEVFEHVPDVQHLMATLHTLLAPGGVVLFSTILSDGYIQPDQRLTWWYASPRNGHISLFSNQSLAMLAEQYGFLFGSFSEGFHALFTQVPDWASGVIRIA